jgi:hypothetical protein
MNDLRTPHEVRAVMRVIFSTASKVGAEIITDESRLYELPPPVDNLGLPRDGTIEALIRDTGARALGVKICAMFAPDLVTPAALSLETFGSLADLLHWHFNSLAQSAAFLAVCEGLNRNPHNVSIKTPLKHVDGVGALTFLHRTRDFIRDRLCNASGFDFTISQGGALMDAKTVATAMSAVIDAVKGTSCI